MINLQKKVLFLYSTKFSGHYHAAEAVSKAIEEIDASIKTLKVETISFISPKIGKIIHKAYLGMIKKTSSIYDLLWDNQRVFRSTNRLKEVLFDRLSKDRFKELFDEFRPDATICTQAFPCGIISRLKRDYNREIKIIAVITDYDVHSYWIYENVDYYMVATEDMKIKLNKKGINDRKIKVTGIPVKPIFKLSKDKDKLRKKLNIDNGLPVILIIGGSYGLGPLYDAVKILSEMKESYQFLVVCGKNERMIKKIELLKSQISNPLKCFGYIDNIDELMEVSNLLITKPGGITITEALLKGIPMIIYNIVKGQESQNYRFLIKEGMAAECKDINRLKEVVRDLLNSDKKQQEFIQKSKEYINPDAAYDIADIILKSI